MMTTNYRKMRLKKDKDRSVANYHPWLFSGAFEKSDREGIPGEVVEVYSNDDSYIATGHYHPGTVMVRVLSFEQVLINDSFWKHRLEDAIAYRQQLATIDHSATNSFRLVHGEGDLLPGLIIDRYDGHLVIQTHSEGMALAVEVLAAALDSLMDPETIYYKIPGDLDKSKWLKGDAAETEIIENNCKFLVNWVEGQKTGFFIDQRDSRYLLGQYSKNKSVLNTFSYSGGFSVYALKAGATLVHSVDSSNKAIQWCDHNDNINQPVDGTHASFEKDVFSFLKSVITPYDIVVLDPPAFAKHRDSIKQAIKGYINLNFEALKKMESGSILFTFSCSQAISADDFKRSIFKAAIRAGKNLRIMHQIAQPADHPISIYHPEGEYLKGLIVQIQ